MQINLAPTELVNKVYQIRSEWGTGLYRVVLVFAQMDAIYLHPIEYSKQEEPNGKGRLLVTAKKPRHMYLSAFTHLSEVECEEVLITLPQCTKRSFNELEQKQRTRYLTQKNRMEKICDPQSIERMLLGQNVSRTINKFVSTLDANRTTLARDLSRYFMCEMDIHKTCMFSLFSRKTNVQERKVQKKLGRPHRLVKTGHNPLATGINVTTEIKRLIEVCLASIKDRHLMTHAAMWKEYDEKYAVRIIGELADGTCLREPHPALAITEGQFKYHVNQLTTKLDQLKKRIGRSKVAKDKLILIGHSRERIPHPGHTYIIDATIGDIYLVGSMDRSLLIGRPVIYAVIDAFSSVIVSIHVSLEGPNMEQAQVALYRAMTDKEELLKTLGVTSLLEGLPPGCKPTFIFSDRGELLSEGARELAEVLQVAQSLAAPYRADWKSLIERYFGIQNTEVIHWEPGAVRSRTRDRGDQDVRLDAVLTVNDLLRILLSLAAEWNMTKDMSNHITAAMMRKNIEATPLGFWNYGLENLHGAPTYLKREDAVRQILPRVKAKANRLGLQTHRNLRFTSTWMRDDETFFELTEVINRADVYLDPDKALSAFLYEPDTGELHVVDLVDKRQYEANDVSFSDIEMVEDYIDLQSVDPNPERNIVKATLGGQRRDLVKKAKAESKEQQILDKRSNTAKTSNIRENRTQEILGKKSESAVKSSNAQTCVEQIELSGWEAAMAKKFGESELA